MEAVRHFGAVLLLVSATLMGATEAPQEIRACDLLRRIVDLEERARGLPLEEIRGLVRGFAEGVVRKELRITSAVVMVTYKREWLTRPYFAIDYAKENYVYLEELDPGLQHQLSRHVHWASVAKSCPGRQLMFEVALDEGNYEKLEAGESIGFSCELAAVIRGGKSIYCTLSSLEPREEEN
jgi:hypothetical protein